MVLTCYSAGAAGNFLASIHQLSANAFKSVIDIDILGSYNTLKATLPYLVESAQKHRVDSNTRKFILSLLSSIRINDAVKPSPAGTGGRIIFVSATLHYRTAPFQAHVSVAKAGIDALSHTVAIEFGPLGVTSNIISPGPIASTEVCIIHKHLANAYEPHTYESRAWTVSFPPTQKKLMSNLSLWAVLVPSVTSQMHRCISLRIPEAT